MVERNTYGKVAGTIIAQTEKAYLLDTNNIEIWIPRSCCMLGHRDIDVGDSVILDVVDWFVDKNEL